MSELKTIIVAILFLAPLVAKSQVLTVKQDGSGDYTTIQDAVDAAGTGDTVLVWPGTYPENVAIEEQSLTLGSLTLTTGDTSYISQTVINGTAGGSCVKILYCPLHVEVAGFTLTNGSGTWTSTKGGGVYVFESFEVLISNCHLVNNTESARGGGACIEDSDAEIRDCRIEDNIAISGGGLYIDRSDVYLANTNIIHNHSFYWGGGIQSMLGEINFDTINRCSIYLNTSASGTDIRKHGDIPLHVVVDTFTVPEPDYYYLYSYGYDGFPADDITYDILHGKISQVSQALYVDTAGSNQNDGLSPESPLRDISFALMKMASDSLSPDTIHLANGIYSPSLGEKFPLSLKSYVSIKGQDRDSTILDCEHKAIHLYGNAFSDHFEISRMTLRNGNGNVNYNIGFGSYIMEASRHSSFRDMLFTQNNGRLASGNIMNSNGFTVENAEFRENVGPALRTGHGHGLYIFYDTIHIINCIFSDNYPDDTIEEGGTGGGARVFGQYLFPGLGTCNFYNCLFTGNHTKYGNGSGSNALGIINSATGNLINCTVGDQTSGNPHGANIGVTTNSTLNIYNSIMYNNEPEEIYMYSSMGEPCSLTIHNSLLQGGQNGILLSGITYLDYSPTNLNTDPLWDTTSLHPYSLSPGSPCIDAGTLALPDGITLPEHDLAGNPRVYNGYVDMGAYEFGPWVGTDFYESQKVARGELTAYPNPFSHSIRITYVTKETGHIVISIHNVEGKLLHRVMDTHQLAGKGEFSWDGSLPTGQLPSGTYILNLTVNQKAIANVKVVKR